MKKSDHKHDYELCMYSRGEGRYSLLNICRICGYRKEVPFKMSLVRRADNSWMWLCRKEDILAKYPNTREVTLDA